MPQLTGVVWPAGVVAFLLIPMVGRALGTVIALAPF
jgi:hypothetical protein